MEEPAETTVVLKMQLHCQRCIKQIHKALMKHKDITVVSVDKEKNLVTVKGTMSPEKLPKYLYEKINKVAEIVKDKEDNPHSQPVHDQSVQGQILLRPNNAQPQPVHDEYVQGQIIPRPNYAQPAYDRYADQGQIVYRPNYAQPEHDGYAQGQIALRPNNAPPLQDGYHVQGQLVHGPNNYVQPRQVANPNNSQEMVTQPNYGWAMNSTHPYRVATEARPDDHGHYDRQNVMFMSSNTAPMHHVYGSRGPAGCGSGSGGENILIVLLVIACVLWFFSILWPQPEVYLK